MTVPFVVRRVSGSEHGHLLRKLQRQILGDEPEAIINPKSLGCYWWIVFVAQVPAGFACMSEEVSARIARLELGGVLPEFQGFGLQVPLIEARVEFARAIGCAEARVYTSGDNYPSANNLIKCGFKLCDGPKRSKNPAGWLDFRLPL